MPTETPSPNEGLAKSYGLDYLNIPVNKEALSADQIAQLDGAMRNKNGLFLLHCATGTRADMLYALKQARGKHWNTQETFDANKTMRFYLQGPPQYVAFVMKTTAQSQSRKG